MMTELYTSLQLPIGLLSQLCLHLINLNWWYAQIPPYFQNYWNL